MDALILVVFVVLVLPILVVSCSSRGEPVRDDHAGGRYEIHERVDCCSGIRPQRDQIQYSHRWTAKEVRNHSKGQDLERRLTSTCW